MNSTTETLHSEIYPALFDVLPDALPEFEFMRTGKGYRSGNTRKINGEEGDSKGKVYVYEFSPGYIKDYRIGSVSLWDYIQERDQLTEPKDVVRRLAVLAGVNLPEQQLTSDELERIAAARRVADAWEATNDFFISCLSSSSNPVASEPLAVKTREYLQKPLSEGGRGYDPALFLLPGQGQDREAPRMELGFMPGLDPMDKHLELLGFAIPERDILRKAVLEAGPGVGTQNVLSFPYRDHTGRIRGMGFRSILKDSDYKYLYTSFAKGERAGILFNLKAVARDKDLVIVESPLDALHAGAMGIKNITALGGSGDTLNKTQIDLAVKFGAARFTLMLDNPEIDRAGASGTDTAIETLRKHAPDLPIYVGYYPEGIKDLDELFAKQGKEGYYTVKDNAFAAWRYQLDRLLLDYSQRAAGAYLTDKQVDELLKDIVTTSAGLTSVEKDAFIKAFIDDAGVKELGVTVVSIRETVDAIRAEKAKEQKSQATRDLLTEAKKQLDKGDATEAVSVLQKGARQISQADKATQFEGLLRPTTEAELTARIRLKKKDLETGYTIDGQDIALPAGAITIVAAPTSHGKTTFLINLALRACERYPDKPVYLFSYEEDSDSVLINAMNTYIGMQLSTNGRKSIRSFYRTGSNEFISREARAVFEQKRKQFFSELIEPGRLVIQYVDYTSETLMDSLYYLSKNGNAGAVFIDYIQLLREEGWKGSRQEELKKISLDLKDVAVETGLPLVLAAQFNREVINAARLHPTKIGEAGDIERAANLILGFWNNNFKPLAGEDELDSLKKLDHRKDALYVEVLKYRGDRVGAAGMLLYDGNTGVIINDTPKSPFFSSPFNDAITSSM